MTQVPISLHIHGGKPIDLYTIEEIKKFYDDNFPHLYKNKKIVPPLERAGQPIPHFTEIFTIPLKGEIINGETVIDTDVKLKYEVHSVECMSLEINIRMM